MLLIAENYVRQSGLGTEVIVWGGDVNFDTGGRYNPSTDSWIATSTTNAPTARADHIAVWTGTEMIVTFSFARCQLHRKRESQHRVNGCGALRSHQFI